MIKIKLELLPLQYSYDALEPIISKSIMELHHDKHHAAYVVGANLALERLEKIRNGEMEGDVKSVMRDLSFNYNGAKLHELFWENMRAPVDNNMPDNKLKKIFDENFGNFELFKKEFTNAAIGTEGSGWVVLWKNKENNLIVGQIEKHNLLGMNGMEPVLVLDMWEHGYYLDYQNNRASYVEKWWQVVNWDYVGHILGKIE